ncbi:MAG: hypothetical protein ABH986_06735 [archaeon]
MAARKPDLVRRSLELTRRRRNLQLTRKRQREQQLKEQQKRIQALHEKLRLAEQRKALGRAGLVPDIAEAVLPAGQVALKRKANPDLFAEARKNMTTTQKQLEESSLNKVRGNWKKTLNEKHKRALMRVRELQAKLKESKSSYLSTQLELEIAELTRKFGLNNL